MFKLINAVMLTMQTTYPAVIVGTSGCGTITFSLLKRNGHTSY
jgi:ABC-type proline/glycine betaine transport system ATPase subunit